MREAEDEVFSISSYLEVLKTYKGNGGIVCVWGRSCRLALRAGVKALGQECTSHLLLVHVGFWDNLEKRGKMGWSLAG